MDFLLPAAAGLRGLPQGKNASLGTQGCPLGYAKEDAAGAAYLRRRVSQIEILSYTGMVVCSALLYYKIFACASIGRFFFDRSLGI